MNAKGAELEEREAQAQEVTLQLAASLDAAWNSRDAEAMAQLFQEQSDFQFHTGRMFRSRAEIEKYYAENVFPGMSEGLRHRATTRHARFIKEDVVIADGEVEVYDLTEPDVQKRVRLRVLGTSVIVEEKGRWYFSAVRLMVPQQ